jgi:hypothetical protein
MAARKSSAVSGFTMSRSPFIWAEGPLGHRDRSQIKTPPSVTIFRDVDRCSITMLAWGNGVTMHRWGIGIIGANGHATQRPGHVT